MMFLKNSKTFLSIYLHFLFKHPALKLSFLFYDCFCTDITLTGVDEVTMLRSQTQMCWVGYHFTPAWPDNRLRPRLTRPWGAVAAYATLLPQRSPVPDTKCHSRTGEKIFWIHFKVHRSEQVARHLTFSYSIQKNVWFEDQILVVIFYLTFALCFCLVGSCSVSLSLFLFML